MVRPVPIPNTAVKHSLADGSGFIDSARVGCRQFFIPRPKQNVPAFFCLYVPARPAYGFSVPPLHRKPTRLPPHQPHHLNGQPTFFGYFANQRCLNCLIRLLAAARKENAQRCKHDRNSAGAVANDTITSGPKNILSKLPNITILLPRSP